MPKKVASLEGHQITRVACGSAHTVAWSLPGDATANMRQRYRAGAALPQNIPLEYNLLQSFPVSVLRNRLILLSHVSG